MVISTQHSKLNIVIVTHMAPVAIGHGGNHRSYQIFHDCRKFVGDDNVTVFSLPQWREQTPTPHRKSPPQNFVLRRIRKGIAWRKRHLLEAKRRMQLGNLWQWKHLTDSIIWNTVEPSFTEAYQRHMLSLTKPSICIVEAACFREVLEFNLCHDIPTVMIPHNIEAFDTGQIADVRLSQLRSQIGDFHVELEAFRKAQVTLLISKVETGLIGGLGLDAIYYPYVPVGTIAERLKKIRNKRAAVASSCSSQRLLMLGSAVHGPTGTGFRWFLRHAVDHGWPKDIHLDIVGNGTEALQREFQLPQAIQCHGWATQDELDQLLINTHAVVVPQTHGFGALTRISELAAAGVPVLCSEYVMLAMDNISGVTPLGTEWVEWLEAIENCSSISPVILPVPTAVNTRNALVTTLTKLAKRDEMHSLV